MKDDSYVNIYTKASLFEVLGLAIGVIFHLPILFFLNPLNLFGLKFTLLLNLTSSSFNPLIVEMNNLLEPIIFSVIVLYLLALIELEI